MHSIPALKVVREQIQREVVSPPDIGAEEGTYERVLERREAMFDGGKAQRLAWPTAMHLVLDERLIGRRFCRL